MKKLVQKLFFTLLACLPVTLFADGALPQNLAQIDALQRRADALTYGDQNPNIYHLAKARAWLDMATSEYYQTDISGALLAAITQAETLIIALENKQPNINSDMPVDFPGSEKIRTDLWGKVVAIKRITNYTCGQRPLAEGEVQLIWAGHEKLESGWSHAEPYAKIAENSINEAQLAIDICSGKVTATSKEIVTPTSAPAPVLAPVATPAVVAPTNATHVLEKITLSADTLFDFDKTTLTRYSKNKLDDLIGKLAHVTSLESINLVGHSDRLRTDGKHRRNQKLSEHRAERIKQYLISKGIPANKITAKGVGSKQPVVECSTQPSKAIQVVCLKPNRRVEVTVIGVQ
jgi:outer membrane protein OmpA-like peptidoglycan-associated protein